MRKKERKKERKERKKEKKERKKRKKERQKERKEIDRKIESEEGVVKDNPPHRDIVLNYYLKKKKKVLFNELQNETKQNKTKQNKTKRSKKTKYFAKVNKMLFLK